MFTCEVCGRTARTSSHPCRFERACACWYGRPCWYGIRNGIPGIETPTRRGTRRMPQEIARLVADA